MKAKYIILTLLVCFIASFFWFLQPEVTNEIEKVEHSVIVQSPRIEGEVELIEMLLDPEEVPVFEELSESQRNDPQVLAYIKAFRTPISFYGKVIDQDGEPVPDATILFSALNKPFNTNHPTTGYTRETDNDGIFSITGIRGSDLTIRVQKNGYQTLPSEFSSVYYSNPTRKVKIPTEENPAVFVLEKLHEPTKLIKKRITKKLGLDGIPVSVLLYDGIGMLTISLNSDYNRDTYAYSAWQAEIKLSAGGFIETDKTYNFEAPIEGYKSELEYRVTGELKLKPKTIERSFYFTLNNGKYYGRMNLFISAAGGFRLEYFVNPSGGRNLNL